MGSELSYIPKLILLIIFPIVVLVAVSIYTYVDKKLDNLSLSNWEGVAVSINLDGSVDILNWPKQSEAKLFISAFASSTLFNFILLKILGTDKLDNIAKPATTTISSVKVKPLFL